LNGIVIRSKLCDGPQSSQLTKEFMTAPSADREAIGRIVGQENNGLIVELESGEHVICRGIKTLHRKLGYHTLPLGQRAKIRYSDKPGRSPLLIEVIE
jgi:hypothetical protein